MKFRSFISHTHTQSYSYQQLPNRPYVVMIATHSYTHLGITSCIPCMLSYLPTQHKLYTVKRLYFACGIFRGFRELDFIREINVQPKCLHRYVIRIFTWFVHDCPVHKMALSKYFNKAPSALPNITVLYCVVCCRKALLQLIAKRQEWFLKTQRRTLCPYIRLEVVKLVSPQRKASILHRESILIHALRLIWGMVDAVI